MKCTTLLAVTVMLALLTACENGLLHQPAPPAAATVAIQYSLMGGAPEAYEKANRISLRFSAGGQVRLQEEIAFTPENETHVPLTVPLRELRETFTLEVELRRDASPLFRGSAQTTLGAGRPAQVDLTLAPIVARVLCSGPRVDLSSYGDVATISGAALFATDDTVFNQAVTFTTSSNAITLSGAAGRSVNVTAIADGDATVQCTAGQASDSRAVRVFAVVQSVTVAPATATINFGATQSFAATLRDARGNPIIGRPVTWVSSNNSVATVSPTGLVTGVGAGTARIDANHEGVTGSANVTVLAPPPAVVTGSAGVVRLSATLNGTVNPNGIASLAWFEYGTSPTLGSGASITAPQSIAGTNAVVGIAHGISNLEPSTTYYYRIVAENNAGGTAAGAIQSFQTPDPGPPIVVTLPGSVDPNFDFFFSMPGEIIPMGADTRAYLEWGFSPDTLFRATEGETAVGSGWDPVGVSGGQFGQSITMYFRWVAYNQFGRTFGDVQAIVVNLGGPSGVSSADGPKQ